VRVAMSDWRLQAACRELDTELFFPVGRAAPARLQVERAKSVCRTCVVVEACLQHALTVGEHHGVWGGLDEEERRLLFRGDARGFGASSPAIGTSS
jgi:WhiB family redox-sensing transcriptional regulator